MMSKTALPPELESAVRLAQTLLLHEWVQRRPESSEARLSRALLGVAEQLEALRKYARHAGNCDILRAPYLGREIGAATCTCGLWEAMSKVSSPACDCVPDVFSSRACPKCGRRAVAYPASTPKDEA